MRLDEFNRLESNTARLELLKCCGSQTWADSMMQHFPFANVDQLQKQAMRIWHEQCSEADWLEAFEHHPKIGDTGELHKKFASTSDWAGAEQAGVQRAGAAVIEELAGGNKEYEDKFGFIFIVCATGKGAEEMLELLKMRLPNNYETEIRIAMEEQNKITQLRLQKLLS